MNDLSETIREMMLANVSEGHSRLLGEDYCYIRPSSEDSPFQSWWDTCLQVIVLCRLGEYPLATRILSSLFAVQEDSGFCGHRVFWKKALPTRWTDLVQSHPRWDAIRPRMSALMQPPLAAVALECIYRGTHDMDYLKRMLAKLIRYFNWLDRERAYDGTGLVSTHSPFESGLPYKPSYDRLLGHTQDKADAALRRRTLTVDSGNFIRGYGLPATRRSRFVVKDVLVNTLYARDLRALSRLCSIARFIQATELFQQRAEKTGRAILDLMYEPEQGAFLDLDAERQHISVATFSLFLPLMLPELPGDMAYALVMRHLRNRREFDLPQGLPTVAATEPAFAPDAQGRFLWRGSVSPTGNWCIWQGLMQHGFREDAERIARATEILLVRNGLRECYDPFTGAGGGAHGCALSGLVLDMQSSPEVDAHASYAAPQLDFGPETSLGGLPAASL